MCGAKPSLPLTSQWSAGQHKNIITTSFHILGQGCRRGLVPSGISIPQMSHAHPLASCKEIESLFLISKKAVEHMNLS